MRRKHKLPIVIDTPIIPRMTEEEIEWEDSIIEHEFRRIAHIEDYNIGNNINDILEKQRERSGRG